MNRVHWICMLALLAGGSLLIAQDEAKTQSGPKKGEFMPNPFECVHINGPAKVVYVEATKEQPGYHVPRPRCLICQNALLPAVLIFTKEPAEGKDEEFTDLLKKLDETAADFQDRSFSVGVVVLSPDARDSSNNAAEEDVDKLIKEAIQREKLIERLKKRTENLKHVILAYYSEEGPKGYKLDPKAEMTVLFYERLRVLENYAYAPGALQAKDVDAMVKRIREELPLRKKAVEDKK